MKQALQFEAMGGRKLLIDDDEEASDDGGGNSCPVGDSAIALGSADADEEGEEDDELKMADWVLSRDVEGSQLGAKVAAKKIVFNTCRGKLGGLVGVKRRWWSRRPTLSSITHS